MPDNAPQAYQVMEHDGDRMVLSVGPHHPSTHGVLRVVIELDGERIVKAQPETGFLHTGIEKNAEALTWQQAITVLDRMDYVSPASNNLGYVLAAEKLLGVEVPPRTAYIRVMLTELQRIASHLVFLGSLSLDLGAQSPWFYAFDLREGILDLYEEVSGARMNPSYFRVGGLARDIPTGFTEMVQDYVEKFPSRLKELLTILDKNPIWQDRLKGVGIIDAEQAQLWGMTGPALRASGLSFDNRKDFPYSRYDEFDFEVPVLEHGDAYDRYLVRVLEMEQSIRIVGQSLEKLAQAGPEWQIDDPKIVRPPKEEIKVSMEALIHHFKIVSHGFDVPAGEVYLPIESPKGEIGFYVVSDGGNKPYRVRVRPPSFYHVYALPVLLQGALIADMVAIIASIDPVFGEVDR